MAVNTKESQYCKMTKNCLSNAQQQRTVTIVVSYNSVLLLTTVE